MLIVDDLVQTGKQFRPCSTLAFRISKKINLHFRTTYIDLLDTASFVLKFVPVLESEPKKSIFGRKPTHKCTNPTTLSQYQVSGKQLQATYHNCASYFSVTCGPRATSQWNFDNFESQHTLYSKAGLKYTSAR
mmetsp:Transcript_41110/g.66212  ORF Transcript_41110/g.66212 Transcript_41110/m.66212 type:complete len:133 (+) Transcript_41110:3055-3453(+)